jgi:hypothetical protein
MKRRIGIAAGMAALALAGCANWDLKKHDVLGAGDPSCSLTGQKQRIWQAEGSNGAATDCAVDLHYRAPTNRESACSATLYWSQANGTPGPGDGPVGSGQPMKAVSIPAASSIELSCNGAEADMHDSCHYEIDKVSCVKAGDVVNSIGLGAMVARQHAGCGQPKATIWTPPAAPDKRQSCNVTVSWSGTDHCSGIVSASYVGNSSDSEARPKQSKLMTFVGVRKLEFECTGTGTGESCTYSIVSTECK